MGFEKIAENDRSIGGRAPGVGGFQVLSSIMCFEQWFKW